LVVGMIVFLVVGLIRGGGVIMSMAMAVRFMVVAMAVRFMVVAMAVCFMAVAMAVCFMVVLTVLRLTGPGDFCRG